MFSLFISSIHHPYKKGLINKSPLEKLIQKYITTLKNPGQRKFPPKPPTPSMALKKTQHIQRLIVLRTLGKISYES